MKRQTAVRGSIFPYLEIRIALPDFSPSPQVTLVLTPNIPHHASLRQEFHLDPITETVYKDKITASFISSVYLTSTRTFTDDAFQDARKSDTFRLDWFNLPPRYCTFLCLPLFVNSFCIHFGRWTLQNTVNLTVITHPILLIIVTHPITWRSMWRIATWT